MRRENTERTPARVTLWRRNVGWCGNACVTIGDATVARAWRKYRVQPWRRETFKFSTDPELEGKIRDVIGLYLAPPDNAIVLSLDEKSQIQALNRTQPVLPMAPQHPEQRRCTGVHRNGNDRRIG